MTRKELEHVKSILLRIKPRENGMGLHGKVQLALTFVEKDISQREAARDNFKGDYELDGYPY